MAKKTILLIEDDAKTKERVLEMLGAEYKVETVRDRAGAITSLQKKSPDLILIDFDLKGEDGLQVFYEVHPLKLEIAVIMFSASGSIPLAVTATKAGVAEFLRKPLHAEQLREAVARNITEFQERLIIPEDLWWLQGESAALNKMLGDIRESLKKNLDMALLGEQGINKREIAQVIHSNGPRRKRKLAALDLAAFRRENMETHFWTVLNKIMALPDASSVTEEEDLCGTIYLDNFASLDEEFKIILARFFKERKGRVDRSIRIIISAQSRIKDFSCIELLPLSERAADLPYFLAALLRSYSDKYNKDIKYLSAELLEFLAAYDYPGNYAELEKLVQGAVFNAAADKIDLKDLPFNFSQFLGAMLKKAGRNSATLGSAKADFEQKLYQIILEKSEGESAKAARFLDIPKATFLQRVEELSP